jgi:hypothetical protein
LITNHSLTITNLTANTTYHFAVSSVDSFLNAASSADFTFTTLPPPLPDTEPPAVVLTAPAAGAAVSGSVAVTASATDNIGVAGVQFLIDGNNLGPEDTSPPYQATLNSALYANGSRSLSAVARDAMGNTGAAASVSITVSNRRGLTFDGIDDVGLGPNLQVPSQISLSFWLKPSGLGESSNGHIFTIRDDTDNNPNVQLRLITGNKLRFFATFDNNGAASFGYWDTPANSVALNSLQHMAVVYDGSSPNNDPVIYINGMAQAITVVARPVGSPTRNQATVWRIGNNPATSGTILGILDEFRIYNLPLTPAQIMAHYNTGQVVDGQNETGLIAGWHFDDTGTTALDYSGNGNHVSLINGLKSVLY